MKQHKSKSSIFAVLLTGVFVVALLSPLSIVDANAATNCKFDGINYTIPKRWDESADLDGKLSDDWYPDKKARTVLHKEFFGFGDDIMDMGNLIMQAKTHADKYNIKTHKHDIINAVCNQFDGESSNIKDIKVAGKSAFTFDMTGVLTEYDDYLEKDESDPMHIRMAVIQNKKSKRVDIIYVWTTYDDGSVLLKDINKIVKSGTAKAKTTKKAPKKKKSSGVLSASKFESSLNAGKDMTGKKVRFKVTDYAPDSAFGYNLMGGKHLNFVSSRNPHVRKGQTITVKVKDVQSFLGSWIISYKKV